MDLYMSASFFSKTEPQLTGLSRQRGRLKIRLPVQKAGRPADPRRIRAAFNRERGGEKVPFPGSPLIQPPVDGLGAAAESASSHSAGCSSGGSVDGVGAQSRSHGCEPASARPPSSGAPPAVEVIRAAAEAVRAADDVHQRGFPRAGRAENRQKLAFQRLQGDIL